MALPAWPGLRRAGACATAHPALAKPDIDSPYPLQYYFEITRDPQNITLHPGLGPNLIRQPYYVVRKT